MLLITLLLASVWAAPSNLLEFDPPVLNITDLNLTNQFRIRLTKAPTAAVQVHFQASGIKFGICGLTFDVKSWNVYQVVSVASLPAFTSQGLVTSVTIHAHTYAQDKTFHNIRQLYSGNRTRSSGAICSSIGDPHYKSFNGLTFSNQAAAAVYLIQSPELDVQTLQGPCTVGAKVTCNHGVSVRYGNSIAVLDSRNWNTIDPLTWKSLAESTGLVNFTGSGLGGTVFTAELPDGGLVKARLAHRKSMVYFDVTVTLSVGNKRLGGICGDKNSDKFKCLDGGSPATLTGAGFTSCLTSWNVTNGDNHFKGQYIKKNIDSTWKMKCVIPPPPAASTIPPITPPATSSLPAYSPTPVIEATTTSTAVHTTVLSTSTVVATSTVLVSPEASPSPTASPRPDFEKEVEKYCTELLTIPGCNNLEKHDYYIHACITDSIELGNYDMTESYKKQYLSVCKTITDILHDEEEPEANHLAEQVQQEAGLGNNTCTNNCSGHGSCENLGCTCYEGFGGLDCSYSLSDLTGPIVNSALGASVNWIATGIALVSYLLL